MNRTPSGWILTIVGKACCIRNDLRLPISKEERAKMPGCYPYYGPTGELDRLSEYRIEGTFALIGEDGDHFLDFENKSQTLLVSGRFNVNNHAHVIASTEDCSAEWFYNYFRHRSLISSLTRQGAGRYKLNKAALEKLPILLPPKAEQDEINSRIRDWDTAIETTERLIAAKEVYIGAVTERIYRRSPGWSRYRLGDFLQETKVLHGHGDYVIGSVGKNGIKPRDEVYSKDLTSNHERNLLVKPGWLCFGLASDCMAFGVNSTNQTYSVSPAYRTFQINGADPRFFEGYLRVFNGRLSKRFLITSARQGKAIDFEGLFNTECYFPSREEQQQIASAVLLMREELDHLRQLREALKRQKRGLMQKLLTGKWRIQMEEGVPV